MILIVATWVVGIFTVAAIFLFGVAAALYWRDRHPLPHRPIERKAPKSCRNNMCAWCFETRCNNSMGFCGFCGGEWDRTVERPTCADDLPG